MYQYTTSAFFSLIPTRSLKWTEFNVVYQQIELAVLLTPLRTETASFDSQTG
jgi:hypothetical protein